MQSSFPPWTASAIYRQFRVASFLQWGRSDLLNHREVAETWFTHLGLWELSVGSHLGKQQTHRVHFFLEIPKFTKPDLGRSEPIRCVLKGEKPRHAKLPLKVYACQDSQEDENPAPRSMAGPIAHALFPQLSPGLLFAEAAVWTQQSHQHCLASAPSAHFPPFHAPVGFG